METDCPVVNRDQGPAGVHGVSPIRQLQGGGGAVEKDGRERSRSRRMGDEVDGGGVGQVGGAGTQEDYCCQEAQLFLIGIFIIIK